MDVKGKVAIVTGASGGIGLATAKLLSEKGAKLGLVARSEDKLQRIAQELGDAMAVTADISKIQDVNRMVEQVYGYFGHLDVLVNNAGRGYDSLIENIEPDTLNYVFDLDFAGQVLAMKQVIPIMRKEGGGSIMNVSSGLALWHMSGMSVYAALKAALAHISLSAREELKEDNINVGVIYPYVTLTAFEENTIKSGSSSWEKEGEKDESGGLPFKPDSAEYVAEKLVEGIESDTAEIFVHDWMKARPT